MQGCVRSVVTTHHAGLATRTPHRRMKLTNRRPMLTRPVFLPMMTLSMLLPSVRSWNVATAAELVAREGPAAPPGAEAAPAEVAPVWVQVVSTTGAPLEPRRLEQWELLFEKNRGKILGHRARGSSRRGSNSGGQSRGIRGATGTCPRPLIF